MDLKTRIANDFKLQIENLKSADNSRDYRETFFEHIENHKAPIRELLANSKMFSESDLILIDDCFKQVLDNRTKNQGRDSVYWPTTGPAFNTLCNQLIEFHTLMIHRKLPLKARLSEFVKEHSIKIIWMVVGAIVTFVVSKLLE